MQKQTTLRRLLTSSMAAISVIPARATAAIFDGGGIRAGLNAAAGINGLSHAPIRDVIVNILINVLNFLALVSVIVIIYAGIRLIVSFGEESARESAQKMIFYTAIGLAIVLLSRVLVALILFILGS